MSHVTLSVVAPCFNEQDNVGVLASRVLKVLRKMDVAGELILVDDCSTDLTRERIRGLEEKHEEVRGVFHERNLGIFGGWRSGLSASRGDYVCFIDSDLQNPPEEIARLFRKLRGSGVDMVQAVRSSIGRLRDNRWLLSRGLNFVLNGMFGMHAQDNKSGFLIAPREVLDDCLQIRGGYRYPHTFIRVSAEHKGYTVGEVETLFEDRKAGRSFLGNVPWRPVAQASVDLAKAFVEFRLTRSTTDFERFAQAKTPTREPAPITGWRRALLESYVLTFPVHKWMVTRRTGRLFHALRRSQYFARRDLDEYRLARLKRVVRHAYGQVPAYRRWMDEHGVKPEDIRTLDDIRKLPLLSKDQVRESLHFDMFADSHKKSEMQRISTSGSTGQPFVIYADRFQLEMRMASTWRASEWAGWQFGDRQARLWHQKIGMTPKQVFQERVDAFFMRRIFIPAFELRDDNIRAFVAKIRDYRPVLVDGYAESFNFLAQYAKAHKIPGFRPKAVISSAQILPEQTRSIIEEEFGAEVFDKYGAREFSGIAYEDGAHQGHLVMAESYIVEVLKDGRPAQIGEVGEVVITDLHNMNVPMIRYRLGDLAEVIDDSQPTTTGRAFPRIGRIEGRTQALVVTPQGTWLPGAFFLHFLKDYDHIVRHFQIVQEAREHIVLKIVPSEGCTDTMLADMVAQLRPWVGGDAMKIDVELVEEIPLVKTGKRTQIVSKLKLDFQVITSSAGDDAERVS